MQIDVPSGMVSIFTQGGIFLGFLPKQVLQDPIPEGLKKFLEEVTKDGKILPIPTPENPWRSPKYVAEACDVREFTVREWCRDGKIKATKVFDQWKILHSDFVAFCQERWGASDG